jgi:hypothetical protein
MDTVAPAILTKTEGALRSRDVTLAKERSGSVNFCRCRSQFRHWQKLFSTALTLSIVFSAISGSTLFSCYASEDPDLARLETKFFQHTYPKESDSSRIERLEKMVFGEAKTGSDGDRLANLITAVPITKSDQSNTESAASTDASGIPQETASSSSSRNRSSSGRKSSQETASSSRASSKSERSSSSDDADSSESAKYSVSSEKYPAVSAIEQKVLGKDFAGEAVENRLARLETKLFGKPASNSADLSDRVDALKQKTGVDIARAMPRQSDWSDDDDDMLPTTSMRSAPRAPLQYAPPGEDGRSFSGRDLRKDFQKAFGNAPSYGGSYGAGSYGSGSGNSGSYGSGSYGGRSYGTASGGSNYGTGNYGFGSSGNRSGASVRDSDLADNDYRIAEAMPPTAPSFRSPVPGASGLPDSNPGAANGLGLNQQVSALESEIFGKTYPHDILPARLNRLEATVFPQEKPAVDKSLPERVSRLLAQVPISNHASNRTAKSGRTDDLGDLAGLPPQQKSSGGLGKLINSLGNLVTGGGAYGGYPVRSGPVVTDPQTGMLYDPYTGNIIDPNTGQVIGRKAGTYGGSVYGGMGGVGMPIYNNFGFNNGFSPYGTPYNPPYGYNPGLGGGAVRFGFGGLGGGRSMWP